MARFPLVSFAFSKRPSIFPTFFLRVMMMMSPPVLIDDDALVQSSLEANRFSALRR